MKKIFFSKNFFIIFSSAVLCGICFVFDLLIPWAVGSILYIPVIVLSLRARKPRNLPIYFSAAATVLTLINLILLGLQPQEMRIITNHILAISIIWFTAVLGMFYKKEHQARSYLAAIVDSSNDAVIGKDLDGMVISWNFGAEKIFGYTAQEIIGHSITCLIPPEFWAEEGEIIGQIKSGETIVNFETIRIAKDNHRIHVSLTLSPIRNSLGDVIGISSIAKDITKRIELEQKMRVLNQRIFLEKEKLEEVLNIEEHLNMIFDINRLSDFVVEKVMNILEVEKCSLMFYDERVRSLSIRASKGIDEGFLSIFRSIDDPECISGLALREGTAFVVEDIERDQRFHRPNRPGYKTGSFCVVPIKLGEKMMGVINVADKTARETGVFSEIDLRILSMIARQVAVALENAKLYREMKYLTVTDPLTNISNFRHFSKSLDYEINRVKRFPGTLSLLMIDVDGFKFYNDTFGHLEGDEALKEIGQVIARNVREVDIACRYAGDEFAVILPGDTSEDAHVVVKKLKVAVAGLQLKRKLEISAGVASYVQGINRYDLIQKADVALYQDKRRPKE